MKRSWNLIAGITVKLSIITRHHLPSIPNVTWGHQGETKSVSMFHSTNLLNTICQLSLSVLGTVWGHQLTLYSLHPTEDCLERVLGRMGGSSLVVGRESHTTEDGEDTINGRDTGTGRRFPTVDWERLGDSSNQTSNTFMVCIFEWDRQIQAILSSISHT